MPLNPGTSDALIVAAAAVVFCLAVVLGVLELRRGRRARERTSHPREPRLILSPKDEVDEDLTYYSRLPKLPVTDDLDAAEAAREGTPSKSSTVFEAGAELDEPTGSKKMFLVWASGQTDPGKVRKRNEDAILLLEDYSLFVVADGMGGYEGGHVASKIACETIERAFRSGALPAPREERESQRPPRAEELVRALEAANDAIRAESKRRAELSQMGATVVGVRFMERKQRAFISHVGDSRCYRFRGGALRLLTKDHTMAEKGVPGPMGQRVRRALGVTTPVQVDLFVDKPLPDDIYVLCSDGLNGMIRDDVIAETLASHAGDLHSAVRALIARANESGGKDNISVVLVGIRSVNGSPKAA